MTCVRRLWLLLALPLLNGCSNGPNGPPLSNGPIDAQPDLAAPGLDGSPDGQSPEAPPAADTGLDEKETGGEAGPDLPPGRCAASLTSAAPFGQVLDGQAEFRPTFPQGGGQPRSGKVAVHVYFPTGRRAGASVILAMPGRYPRPGLTFTQAFVLDATGGVGADAGLRIRDDLGSGFRGALVGPDQGLEGTGHIDSSFGTDVADPAEGPIRLCPSGPVPAAKLIGDDGILVPNLPLYFAPTAPLDPAQLSLLKVMAGAEEVPTQVSFGVFQFGGLQSLIVTPVAAFPPNRSITIETAGVHDVLGRPFTVENLPRPLVTTTAATDLTFATAPPAGALMTATGAAPIVRDGQLVIGAAGTRTQERVLISLGDPGSQTRVRVRIGVDCQLPGSSFALPLSTTAAVVGVDGQATTIPLACGPVTEREVARPAAGPLWLSLVLAPARGHPQSLPFPGGNGVRIDEISFP